MKIVHIDLTGPYTVGMNYQENLLADINAQDGHDVCFIATDYIWKDNGIRKTKVRREVTPGGVSVIRLPYKNLLFPLLTDKLRAVDGLEELLCSLNPDMIMIHGYQTLGVLPLARYLKKHPGTKVLADTHADGFNSARNLFSRAVLHRFLYARLAHVLLKYTAKILCISYDVMRFTEKMNKVPPERLEFYPLGGKLFTPAEYTEKRERVRARCGIAPDDILLVHTGKMSAAKKTAEIFDAMDKTKDRRLRCIIIGAMDGKVREAYENAAAKDTRIQYLGWKDGGELLEYLCAGDIYLQPGTQSATMQNAACCRCALALYPYESHKYLFGDGAFYVTGKEDLAGLFEVALKKPETVRAMRERSYQTAEERLDYKKLAAKLYDI